MLFKAFIIHPLSIVNNDDSCVLITQVRGKKDMNVLCTSIERIRNKFFYSFIWAGIETFGEKLNNPVTDLDINLVYLAPRRLE